MLPLLADHSGDTFGFIWSVDTHYPYLIPGHTQKFSDTDPDLTFEKPITRFASEHGVEKLQSLYRDCILYNDNSIGELIQQLKKTQEYKNSLFFLLGDHGEEFGEHGHIGHSGLVHEQQIRVPLILKLPNNKHGGKIIETPVSLVDIFPTIVSQLDITVETPFDGNSLTEVIAGEIDKRPILAETFPNPGKAVSRSVRYGRYKWISVDYPGIISQSKSLRGLVSNITEIPTRLNWRNDRLYDLKTDPEEHKPLESTEEPEQMKVHRTDLLDSVRKRETEVTSQTRGKNDKELKERLQKLGYID